MPSPNFSSPFIRIFRSSKSTINALLDGEKWGAYLGQGAILSYSFPDSDSVWSKHYAGRDQLSWEATNNFYAMTLPQQAQVNEALQAWSNIANIQFKPTIETKYLVGNLRFAFSGEVDDEGAYAYAYTPSAMPAAGDVWISTAYNQDTLSIDFMSLLQHEIGHSLGLKHPFESGKLNATLPAEEDYVGNTIMSYRMTTDTQSTETASLMPTTPMVYDIAAIQYLYGANMRYHKGNDTYVFLPDAAYYQTIWDAGGTDTIDYSASVIGTTIDLRPGHWSQLGKPIVYTNSSAANQNETVAIAFKVTIEIAIGGSGSDTLIGNNASNSIIGNEGDDHLYGDRGADTLEGGGGDDFLDGGRGPDWLWGGAGDDTLIFDKQDHGIDGGGGVDTLKVDGTNLTLTLSKLIHHQFSGIEILDLTGNGDNRLVVDQANFFSNQHDLYVVGNAGDSVSIVGINEVWNDTGMINVDGYHLYTHVADSSQENLYIMDSITQH